MYPLPLSDNFKSARYVYLAKTEMDEFVKQVSAEIYLLENTERWKKFPKSFDQFISALLSFSEELYHILSRRGSSEEIKKLHKDAYEKYDVKYLEAIVALTNELHKIGIQEKLSDGWWHFRWKTDFVEEKKAIGLFKITHKLYFTLFLGTRSVFNDNSAQSHFGEIATFLLMLSGIGKRLYELSQKAKVRISFKTPQSLLYFLRLQDSLVIHFYQSSGKGIDIETEINKIITEEMLHRGIRLGRTPGRSTRGFDLKPIISNRSDDASKDSMSHTQFVARLILQEIVLNRPAFWKNEKSFKMWIIEKAEKYSNLSLEKALPLLRADEDIISDCKKIYLKNAA